MDIKLRHVRPSDYSKTEHVAREAFWNHYNPGCMEHYLLHIMRSCPQFVSELDIVAVSGDQIIGNVVFMEAAIHGDDGRKCKVLSLGPIAVLPEYQNKGIGGKMIAYTKKIAQKMGYRAIFLCGDPDYYSKQGFVPAETFGIRTADNMYAAALQVCELYEGALSRIKGCYFEHEIYQIDEEAGKEFDKNFPEKEWIDDSPSQRRFKEISAMVKKPESF